MERKRLVADRFKRIWSIASFIAQQPGLNRAELAQHFALSERQFQADLNVIRDDIGLPLTRAQGYRFATGCGEGGGLSLRDVWTLAVLMDRARDDPEIPQASLQELAAKLPLAFPPPLQPLVRKTLSPLTEDLGPSRGVFACVAGALVRQQPVKLCYPAPEGVGHLAEPIVDPQILLPYQRSWYLIGRCHQRKRVVMFCLDRLESATTDL